MADPALNAANDISIAPDSYGQAAILLVESLIHGLILRAVISAEDAVEIVETAAEVKAEIDAESEGTPAKMNKARAALEAMATSLRQDVKSVE